MKSQLEHIQKQMEEEEVCSEQQKMECMISHKLHKALRSEEEAWRLKSRNVWLKFEDKNTSYFYRQEKARTLKNNVKETTLDNGSKIKISWVLKTRSNPTSKICIQSKRELILNTQPPC
jgi:hypothetical protein